jgi:2-haloacid dehalogenase
MSPAPKTVVFDIGNVLIEWDMRNLYRKVFDDHERMEWFLANVCTMAFNIEQDRGRPFAEAVAQLTRDHPDWAEQIRHYDERWTEMIAGPVLGSVEILQELQSRGVPTYAITNFSREKFDVTCRMFPFLTTFAGTVVSADERLLKPDRRIFELFLDRYSLRARDCIFIDDTLPNVESSKQLGFHALHFTGAPKLRADLVDLGVL